ncbi:MBL fold metallo-hydrolase [Desulfosarcina ovata]|uniref:MBL fold hydrolase n=1 Tax=Desulfosarcina ovata subsp. ovata TaxID=2752305 RepID=A0A5K8AIV0_9BACT|nr:MBL fold metallo-hydrolase [Desulfosarcina ovata]BBO91810.1 MBL fold hydrolase [Desulfosarcina ovata subsp. ovata]
MHTTVTIVYDNTTRDPALLADWGFACVVASPEKTVLFDTGANATILQRNMDYLEIDPKTIDAVFISHAHWDHSGGLAPFVERFPVEVYVPRSYQPDCRDVPVHRVDNPLPISQRLFSTGEVGGMEQALVVDYGDACALIVGCSHPGVAALMESAAVFGRVGALIGGLHGFNQLSVLTGLDLVCPTHCTQHGDSIRMHYPGIYRAGGVGTTIPLPPMTGSD